MGEASSEGAPDLGAAVLDELHGPEARALFDTVDTLSALGVEELVDLPRIIVVGQQSAGKSSVLQAISGVKFPTRDGVCTRFATELILRTGKQTRVKATIRFHDKSKDDLPVQVGHLEQDSIGDIISKAREDMGIPDDRGYSKNVLRLEIQGPKMLPLTLVDLPGVYDAETDEQSLDGIPVVKELVHGYMKQPNSIILAIIHAGEQLANQRILEEVYKHDVRKDRTLGVITKPDLLRSGSSIQDQYIQLLRGKSTVHKLALGWHVVRNRTDHDETLEPGQADSLEADFFRTGDWASVKPANRGISALRKKLSHILYEHIKGTLPAVLDDIESQLAEREEELSQLGQPRSTSQDMRAYLVDVASRFQKLTEDGVGGNYHDRFFGGIDGTDRKLRARLRMFNRVIRHVLLAHGSTYLLSDEEGTASQGANVQKQFGKFLSEVSYGSLPQPQVTSREALASQLEKQAAANQGMELPGFPKMDLVTQLFKEQAKPWEGVADQHLQSVTAVAREFVEEVIHDIVGVSDSSTATAILTAYVHPFFDAQEESLTAKLQEILRPFKQGYALPLDDEFCEALEERADARAEEEETDFNSANGSDEYGTGSIINVMQTFYELSLRTFTGNLINLAVESCLIQELAGIFTPRIVSNLSDDSLAELAAESEEVSLRRSQLVSEIGLLRQGLKKCRHYRPRLQQNPGTKASQDSNGNAVNGKLQVEPATPRSTSAVKSTARAPGNPSPTPSPFSELLANASQSQAQATAKSNSSSLFGSSSQSSGQTPNKAPNPGRLFGTPAATSATTSSGSFGSSQNNPFSQSSGQATGGFSFGTAAQGGVFGKLPSTTTTDAPKSLFSNSNSVR